MIRATPFVIVMVAVLGCGSGKDESKSKKTTAPPPAKATQPVPPSPVEVEKPKEKEVYAYSGDRFRNPFIPAGKTNNYKPDAIFNPEQASVKAIIHSRRMRSAVLNVRGSGSYFVNAGRIFDIMGKTVKGFTARVFVNRVVVSGEGNAYVLKIRNKEEDGGTL